MLFSAASRPSIICPAIGLATALTVVLVVLVRTEVDLP